MQLKWLPKTQEIFFAGLMNGYNIYRAEAVSTGGGEKLTEYVQLNSNTITCWTEQKLLQEVGQDSTLSIVSMFVGMAKDFDKVQAKKTPAEAVEQAKAKDFVSLVGLFASVSRNKVAEGIGLYFVDTHADPTKKYVYKIEIPEYDQFTSYQLIFPTEKKEVEKVVGVTAELTSGAIHLSWYNNNNRNYPYYNIYRSTKKNKGFVKLNNVPYMGNLGNAVLEKNISTYIDSFPEFDQTYFYQIIGVNSFEQEGGKSEIVEITAYYLLNTRPRIVETTSPDNESINLSWEVAPEDEPYITKFTLKRARRGEGPYQKVHKGFLNKKTLSFEDIAPFGGPNYYAVCAYGSANDSICSLLKAHLLVDSIPPAPPVITSGECDTNGIVTIKWQIPTDEYIAGYRVFKTYYKKKEPIRITKSHILDSIYIDTINVREPYNKIYYRIAALDASMNASAPSEYFEVEIPDMNPPANGYLKTYEMTKDGIFLTWEKSPAYDLKYMYLMRKSKFDFEFQPILKLSGDSLEIRSYLDTATKTKVTYEYAMMSEDEAGLSSGLSNIFTVRQTHKEKVIGVTNLEAFVSRENQMIKLVWVFPKRASGFKIYRAEDGGELKTYQFAPGDKREYYDKWVKPNTTYTYLMMAEMPGGFKSGFSQKIEVKY